MDEECEKHGLDNKSYLLDSRCGRKMPKKNGSIINLHGMKGIMSPNQEKEVAREDGSWL